MATHRTDRDRDARPSILVVDDDELMRRLLARRLETLGFEVARFDDPRALLAALGDLSPDGVFTDLEMPSIDGIGVISAARAAGYEGFVGLVTAESDPSRLGEAVAAGADSVLFKPVGGRELAVVAARIGAGRRRAAAAGALDEALGRVEQGAILLDAGGRIVFANRAAREVFGASDPDAFDAAFERCRPHGLVRSSEAGRSAVTYHDIRVPGRDARLLIGIEAHALSRSGEAAHLLLLHDFSRWRRVDDIRTRFATSLSHRMRTPLTAARNAVRMLGDNDRSLPGEQREKLLDIGWRNIERLVENLDELQKLYMIESNETETVRTLARLDSLVKRRLESLEQEGSIRGFRFRSPCVTAFVGRCRLRDFLTAAIDSLARWSGEKPFVDCAASIRENFHESGGIDRRIKLVVRSRSRGGDETSTTLGEFLSCDEAHRGLVLARLAAALDGELDLDAGGGINLLLPLHPGFDREKDLVQPMHMMAERAELSGRAFHLVSLRLVGAVDDAVRFARIVETSLCRELGENVAVARSEEPLGYSIVVAGDEREEIEARMRRVRERFETACRRSGEEIHPTIRWEIRFSREARGGDRPALDLPALETV